MVQGHITDYNSEKSLQKHFKELEKIIEGEEVETVDNRFLIASEKSLEAYYAPYRFKLSSRVEVLLIGITPGRAQMLSSYKAFREKQDLRSKASFSTKGTDVGRKNLIQMLDDIGLANVLGISSTDLFYSKSKSLCAMTSIARFPVLKDGKDYTGHSPNILRSELIKRQAELFLFPKLKRNKNRLLIIPLGKAVTSFLNEYYQGKSSHTVLQGFPHFSGANAHRKRHFEENLRSLKKQVKKHFS
jgi:hypothetical protein